MKKSGLVLVLVFCCALLLGATGCDGTATTTTTLPATTSTTLNIGDQLRAEYPSSDSFTNDDLDVLLASIDSYKGAAVSFTGQLTGHMGETGWVEEEPTWVDDTGAINFMLYAWDMGLGAGDDGILCRTDSDWPLLKIDNWVEVQGLVIGPCESGDGLAVWVESVTQGENMDPKYDDQLVGWGATAEVGGLSLRLTVSEPVRDNDLEVVIVGSGEVDPDNRLLRAKVVLENTGSTAFEYTSGDFELYDDSRNSYKPWFSEDSPAAKPDIGAGTLQPGEEVVRYLRYVVPNDAEVASIKWDQPLGTIVDNEYASVTWGQE